MQEFYYKLIEDGSYCVLGYRGDEARVSVPASYGGLLVTVLNDHLFRGHGEIVALSLPDSVTDMGEFLFEGCLSLRWLKLPAGLRTLWGCTFARSSLEEIVLPDQVQTLPSGACRDCRQLKRISGGAGLRRVYPWAFEGCPELTETNFGPDVQISPEAFAPRPRRKA